MLYKLLNDLGAFAICAISRATKNILKIRIRILFGAEKIARETNVDLVLGCTVVASCSDI